MVSNHVSITNIKKKKLLGCFEAFNSKSLASFLIQFLWFSLKWSWSQRYVYIRLKFPAHFISRIKSIGFDMKFWNWTLNSHKGQVQGHYSSFSYSHRPSTTLQLLSKAFIAFKLLKIHIRHVFSKKKNTVIVYPMFLPFFCSISFFQNGFRYN